MESLLYDAGTKLEKLICEEDGFRDIQGGASSLHTPQVSGMLYDVANSLFMPACKHIVLLVGSTSNMIMWPPTDTDGPGGCFALAHALLLLQKSVTIVSDSVNTGQIQPALEASEAWLYNDRHLLNKLKYEVLNDRNSWTDEDDAKLERLVQEADHIMNVGCPGPSEDGEFYSHDNRQMTHYQPRFDKLFDMAGKAEGKAVSTSCIGELGNELGMGSLREAVVEMVKNGSKIFCPIRADYVVVATTVNQGAFGICAMLGLIAVTNDKKGTFVFDDYFPTRQDQTNILKVLIDEAARCGVTGTRDLIIDKYPLAKFCDMLEFLRSEARDLLPADDIKNVEEPTVAQTSSEVLAG